MRSRICSSEIRVSRFGLLNSDVNWAEEVATCFSFNDCAGRARICLCAAWCDILCKLFLQVNMRNINRLSRTLLCALALTVFVVPAFGQGTAIQPCPATPAPKPGVDNPRAQRLPVDSSIPDDPDVVKIIAPYTERVRDLSKVMGRLEGDLKKGRVGAGSL